MIGYGRVRSGYGRLRLDTVGYGFATVRYGTLRYGYGYGRVRSCTVRILSITVRYGRVRFCYGTLRYGYGYVKISMRLQYIFYKKKATKIERIGIVKLCNCKLTQLFFGIFLSLIKQLPKIFLNEALNLGVKRFLGKIKFTFKPIIIKDFV